MPHRRLLSLVIAWSFPWYNLDSFQGSTRKRDATVILQSSCTHDNNDRTVRCNVTVQSEHNHGPANINSQPSILLEPCGGADNLLVLHDLEPGQAHLVRLLDCYVYHDVYQERKAIPVMPHPSTFLFELSDTLIERQVTFDFSQLPKRIQRQGPHYSDFFRMLETFTDQELQYVGHVGNVLGVIFGFFVTIYAWIKLSLRKHQHHSASETTFRTALSTLSSHRSNRWNRKSIDSASSRLSSSLPEHSNEDLTSLLRISPRTENHICTNVDQLVKSLFKLDSGQLVHQSTSPRSTLSSANTKKPLQDFTCSFILHEKCKHSSSDLHSDILTKSNVDCIPVVSSAYSPSRLPKIDHAQVSASDDQFDYLLRRNVCEHHKFKRMEIKSESDGKFSSATKELTATQHNVVHGKNSFIVHREPSSDNEPKRLIMLLSYGICDRFQSKHQHRAIMLLESKGTPFVTVDAMDSTQRTRRDELLLLSDRGTIYPQFFLERRDGTTTYIGDWETLQDINDIIYPLLCSKSLPKYSDLEASFPSHGPNI